jgi:hypothetical protein
LRSVQPHVPEALEMIVHRAMARDMGQRFPDVKSLLEALEDLVRLDVSNVPNKMSSGNTGRMAFPVAGERGDVSHSGRVAPSAAGAEIALARRSPVSNPAAFGPATPAAGSKSLGRVAPTGALAVARPHRWNRAIPIVAALGLVGGVVALAIVRARHDLPPEIAVGAAAAASAVRSQPATPALSELVVVVTPPTAKIVVDGVTVEGNPYTGHYRKDQIHEISASAVGYEAKSQGVVLAKDLVVTLALDRKRDSKKATWAPAPRAVGMRRPPDARRSAKITAPILPESDDFEMPAMRPAAIAPRAAPAPAPTTVNPAGGRAPIHPIETASPYESR